MRLIDIENINPIRCPQSIQEMRMWLYEMPTINAIPIEWINTKIDLLQRKRFSIAPETNDMWNIEQSVLIGLIYEWEKENEQNKGNTSQTD